MTDRPALRIEVQDPRALLGPRDLAALRSDASRVAAALAERFSCAGEVRARLVDDREMTLAHERHTSERGTTDVLTFDMRTGEADPLDADVLVCFDEAARQAATRGHPPAGEALLYILHACLHCLGHDDHDPAEHERMHRVEDEVLERAGIGPIYNRAESRAEKSADRREPTA